MDCLFCQIVRGDIPANLLYEDDDIVAFDDVAPKAPLHKLIIPKRHIATLNDATAEDSELLGRLLLVGKKLALDLEVAEPGYRLVFNCNPQAGQTVFHIHLHFLAGRAMNWPPG